jgi:hypothetical protein
MSAEIAISPANPWIKPGPGGNESTSVVLSFPRKRRFRRRNSLLSATRTLTTPLSLASRAARPTNRAKSASFSPTTDLRTITNVLPCARNGSLVLFLRQSPFAPASAKKQTGGALFLAPSCAILPALVAGFYFGGRHDVFLRRRCLSPVRLAVCIRPRLEQQHLLLRGFGFVLVVGPYDALH